MTRRLTRAFVAAAFALAAVPALAHHAVQAVFDVNRPVAVTGAVTSVEWTNPHAYITVDVRSDKDTVQHWVFAMAGPGALRQAGLSSSDRSTVKPGDIVTVEGIAAKDGSTTGFLYRLRVADGRVIDLLNKAPRAR